MALGDPFDRDLGGFSGVFMFLSGDLDFLGRRWQCSVRDGDTIESLSMADELVWIFGL